MQAPLAQVFPVGQISHFAPALPQAEAVKLSWQNDCESQQPVQVLGLQSPLLPQDERRRRSSARLTGRWYHESRHQQRIQW